MENLRPGVGVILYRADQILLQLRTFDAKSFPSFWGTFGGQIEDDELPESAAIREIDEELGVRLEQSRLTSLGTINVPRGIETAKVYCFSAALEVELRDLSLGEGDGFGLFTLHEVYNLRLTPETRLAVDRHYKQQGFGWES